VNWDEIIDEANGDENRADSGAPSGGRSHTRVGNDYYNCEGEEDTQGGEKGTWQGQGLNNGRGNERGWR